MQDDNLKNMGEIIRRASDSYHPAYDEKAWNKMEELLGKRLPQNEKKRSWLFFIVLLIGIGFIAFLILMIKSKKKYYHLNASLSYPQIENNTPDKNIETYNLSALFKVKTSEQVCNSFKK